MGVAKYYKIWQDRGYVSLETSAPMQLNRREDYYIWKTQADVRHLNRIKVAR